ATLPEVRVEGAQDAPRAEMQGARKEVTLDPGALPAGITVVTPAELETLNIGRDISNVFRRVPGVVAGNVDQGDTANGFRTRGFATQGSHGADTAVYVDGVPQNMPSSQAGAGHGPAFLEWLVPGMIGRITVIKGPVSALYGDQNRAGAVSIDTPTGEVLSSAAVSLESYGGRRGSLVLSRQLGASESSPGVNSLLVADVYRTDSYRRDGRLERDNVFWKLTAPIGDGLYSARVNHYRSDFVAPGFLLLGDLRAGRVDPRSSQFGFPGYGSGERTALVLNRVPARGEAGWYATAYAESFERVRAIPTSSVQHNVGSDDRHFFGGRLSRNFTWGDDGALVVGTELRRDKGEAIRQVWRDRSPTPQYLHAHDLDLLTYGLFAQGQYRPLASLKLLAGVRRDTFDYEIDNRKLPAASTDYRASVTTPKLGAVWTLGPKLDVYANVAEGFRSPAAEQISGSGSAGPLNAPGGTVSSVRPTKVRSYDLGFTATPLPGWTAGAGLYKIDNEDEIVGQPDGSFQSVGSTTRRGFELETRWQASVATFLYASYGRVLSARANNPLPTVGARLVLPRHTLKAGIEHRMPMGPGRLILNGDAYLTAGTPYYEGTPQIQLRTMPTYTRFDLKATYERGQYQFSAFAIFQPREFATDASYGTAAGLMVSPQPKTQVGASVRYFF
ncbi:MAG TPA: TonB-dependent receptor, partial [Ramlibacter sp.]|nr:TonB-dependent receptor [Ramlibacter sp.]